MREESDAPNVKVVESLNHAVCVFLLHLLIIMLFAISFNLFISVAGKFEDRHNHRERILQRAAEHATTGKAFSDVEHTGGRHLLYLLTRRSMNLTSAVKPDGTAARCLFQRSWASKLRQKGQSLYLSHMLFLLVSV